MTDIPTVPPPFPPTSTTVTTAPLEIQGTLLDRAKDGDAAAMTTMFKQFLCDDETVLLPQYLGRRGLWGGEHCWGCVTERRACSLRVGSASELTYQDALLEGVNSCAIYQPSLMPMYITIAVLVLAAIPTFGVTLLAIPLAIHGYHRHAKCGLAFVVREGLSVFIFCNRKRLTLANRMYRAVMQAREARVAALGPLMQVSR